SVVCGLLAVGAACEPMARRHSASQSPGTPADSTVLQVSPAPPPPTPPPPAATKVASIAGFLTPESVLHDTTQDIYFVSNSLASLGAVFLNDIAIAPTGALYITDTGIRFDDVGNVLHPGPDRVFRIGPDRKVTVAVRGDTLGRPNGIALDPVGKRFVIVEFGGRSLLAWKPEDKAPSVIAKGPGGFDGVVIAGGKILVSSWNDSTVSSY